MAIASVGGFASGNSISSSTTLVLTASAQLDAGNVGILVIAKNNVQTTDGETSEVSGVVDSAGNTWTKLKEFCNGQGGAAAGATVSVWMTKAESDLAISGTITITFSSAIVAKAATAHEFTVTSGNSLQIVTSGSITLAEDGVDNLSAMVLSSLSSKEYLFLRGAAVEGRNDTWNTSTSYTIIASAQGDTGTAGTSMQAKGEFRVLTGTGDTSNPGVLGANRDSAHVFMALEEYSLGPTTITGVGDSAGVATAIGVGRSTNKGVGSSTGLATVAGVGRATAKAVGASAGIATAAAVGQTIKVGAGASAGLSTATAVANSTNKAVGLSAGIATAEAVGVDAGAGTVIVTGDGLSQGSSTVTGIGRSTAKAVGLSQGLGTVTGIGRSFNLSVGLSQGVASVIGISSAIKKAIGLSAGVATVTGISDTGVVVFPLLFDPTGIPSVYADGNGNMFVAVDTAESPTDVPSGIPGVTSTADGRLRVAVDNLDVIKVRTGIPGVLATLARQLCVTEGGGNVVSTGFTAVFADGIGNMRVKLSGSGTMETGIPGVQSELGAMRVSP